MVEINRIRAERKHTLFFLRFFQAVSPVFLDTDVDMTRIKRWRERSANEVQSCSIITYVIWAASRVLAQHPEANAAISGGLLPRVVRYRGVDVKLAVDKQLNGQRIVLSVPIRGLDKTSLEGIQAEINRYRTTPIERLPEAKGILLLHRLPAWIGWVAFSIAMAPLRLRRRYMGTFAVSSLGHRPINGFYAVGGTAITLNLGQMRDCAVVRDGNVVVAPQLRINMAFDHRILDGALAADVLSEIKEVLERGDMIDEWPVSEAATRLAAADA